MIYFDCAATSLQKPDCVGKAVGEALTNMGNSGRGVYGPALTAARTIYRCREQLAALFHTPGGAKQIVFTSGATESLNIAIRGLFSPGQHVITTAMEHNSVLRPLYLLRQAGVELTIVPGTEDGVISPAAIEAAIRPNTAGIVCTHASNLCGNVTDIAAVGKIAGKHGCTFVVDASQTAGVFDIDMEERNIDVLCCSGHKGLLSPQGVGVLAVREGVAIRPWKVGGTGVHSYSPTQPEEMPTALEAGTLNGHGIAGLSAALEYLDDTGLSAIREKEQALAQRFYEGVGEIPGVRLYGDFSHGFSGRTGVVALNLEGVDSARVADALAEEYGICVRGGAHCAPLAHETFGTREQGAVRFSFSHFNTEEEVDAAIAALQELNG